MLRIKQLLNFLIWLNASFYDVDVSIFEEICDITSHDFPQDDSTNKIQQNMSENFALMQDNGKKTVYFDQKSKYSQHFDVSNSENKIQAKSFGQEENPSKENETHFCSPNKILNSSIVEDISVIIDLLHDKFLCGLNICPNKQNDLYVLNKLDNLESYQIKKETNCEYYVHVLTEFHKIIFRVKKLTQKECILDFILIKNDIEHLCTCNQSPLQFFMNSGEPQI
ncbi:hypothetical protein EDEG_03152 [Edhazardia aedis USNM 41457]|uniref:Uncharacterized protein n=1 Tax=Edhazardia aedis (strain USNM 41457) TaxID=1003232 RepID=J9DM12_EDHAE|nr:hypothetical protein EDEG_03152 [Edhazardia aedis USNM 41457]|eukprot:EJW02422.1 hypothetical protein EDEG_03152 [Edhazardia aedis USNM 41457]